MWEAEYLDGNRLSQFDNGTERLFAEIDQDKLSRFNVYVNDKEYAVDLTNGKFVLDGNIVTFAGLEEQSQYRLVYFRRIRKQLSTEFVEQSSSMIQCLGFEITLNGKKHTRIMRIASDNEVSFEVK